MPGQLYLAIVGALGLTHKEFKFEEYPLSTNQEVVIGLVIYATCILLLKNFMAKREAFKLKTAFAIHNFLLSSGSLLLLVLILEALIPALLKNGVYWGVCSADVFNDKTIELFYYINYLFKYWELLDTAFLILKKKPLQFLHWYHHSLTMVLCFIQIQGQTAVQWVPICLNLTVHVIMYYYYFMSSLGYRIWWKKYLTTMQITQFVIDLGACYFCTYLRLAYDNGWDQFGFTLPLGCAGDLQAAYFGCGLLSSYLGLFIEFFWKTYVGGKKKDDKKKQS